MRYAVCARHSAVDELCGHLGLEPPHVLVSEKELTVQVGDVDRVHVDYVDVPAIPSGLNTIAIQTAFSYK